jgi:3-methyl-2-oxobutanoate hydroxymethyltransferase
VAQFLTARLRDKMKHSERIVSLTAYDYFTALIAREADADFVLVGDSLGNVIQGAGTTVPVTLEQAIYHTQIVCRHFPAERVVLDMPFGTFKLDAHDTVRNCVRAFQESGCGGVKFEGATTDNLAAAAKLVEAGVPVLGHLGLLPQQVYATGGYRLQGRTARQAKQLLADAKALAQAGCFGVVLECVVPEVAREITGALEIPTIGIGCGASTAGQIIVMHDILGMLPGEAPSFVKRYADLYDTAASAAGRFAEDVRQGRFPESGAKAGTGALYGVGGRVEAGR